MAYSLRASLTSCLPEADVFVYLGRLLYRRIPCPLPFLCGPWQKHVRCGGPTVWWGWKNSGTNWPMCWVLVFSWLRYIAARCWLPKWSSIQPIEVWCLYWRQFLYCLQLPALLGRQLLLAVFRTCTVWFLSQSELFLGVLVCVSSLLMEVSGLCIEEHL